MLKNLLFLFSALITGVAYCQPNIQSTETRFGVELGSSLSYTGINLSTTLQYHYGKNIFSLGPKLVLSSTYLPSSGPWGMDASYRRVVSQNKRWTSSIALAYLNTFLKPYNPQEIKTSKVNLIHEVYFSYRFDFSINEHWSVGNNIGIGGYNERYHDLTEGIVSNYIGYSSLFKLNVIYKL